MDARRPKWILSKLKGKGHLEDLCLDRRTLLKGMSNNSSRSVWCVESWSPVQDHSGVYVNTVMNPGLVFGWRHLEQLGDYYILERLTSKKLVIPLNSGVSSSGTLAFVSFKPSWTNSNPNYTKIFNSYRAVNILRLGYKNQSV